MNVRKVLEKHGFKVEKVGKHEWDISQYTPAGEDWHITLAALKDLEEFCNTFDPEDNFAMWMEARHKVAGVPKPYELWKDQLWKENVLNEVLEDL